MVLLSEGVGEGTLLLESMSEEVIEIHDYKIIIIACLF
jgi:hypothetical protein